MSKNVANFSGEIKSKKKDFTAKTTKIAQDVISKLEQEDIPIFPNSFETVFEKLIADESEDFKNIFGKKSDINIECKDRLLGFETSVKDGIKNVKDILDITRNIYQAVVFAQNSIGQKSKEIAKIDNSIAFKSAIEICLQDFENLQLVLEGQIIEIKEAFEKIAININNVNKNAIYDTQYGVYNKRYFLLYCEEEKRLLDEIECPCAFVTFALTKSFLARLRDKEFIKISLKTMAKILVQESFSNEVSCYYGGGKFIIFYKYIDSNKVLERVRKILSSAKENNLVLNNEQITLDFCAGVRFAQPNNKIEDEIEESIATCDRAFHGMIDIEISNDLEQEKNKEQES